jgi:eukaryotic-like serine/threonine-protein kinase
VYLLFAGGQDRVSSRVDQVEDSRRSAVERPDVNGSSKEVAGDGAPGRDSHVDPRPTSSPPQSHEISSRREEAVDTASSPPPIAIGAFESAPPSSRADSIVSRDTVPAPLPAAEAVGPLSRTLAAGESLPDEDSHDDAVADPLIGLVVADRYRIVDRIGRGGMGIVYRVEHTSIGKLLAMKLLAGELSAKKEVVRRFKLEALTVSRLSCPHTVQVFDYGIWNHLTYLVMELVDGMDLSRMVRRYGPLPFSRLGRLMVQVCASLEEAHEKGITHRDIKPENIMVIADARGVEMAKVLDFGLAKLRESSELNEVTLQGAVVGTPYFISPEQVYGEDVDGRSDIYSLGAVMYRGLTGAYPFQAKNPMGMFTKHLNEPAPSACAVFPDLEIPSGVSEAIEKCMAKSPADRFQSIHELRETLLAELGALPLSSQERISIETAEATPSEEAMRRRKKAERAAAAELVKSQIATRAELEAYERKLRRTRYGAWVLLALIVAAGLGGAATYLLDARARGLAGHEKEPNDSGAEANRLQLGTPVSGHLGKRIDRGTADRDFYGFDLPQDGAVRLEVTALPNIPICAIVYRIGFTQPLAELCTGYAGLDLKVPNLRLAAGGYFVALTQDLLHQGPGETRYVVENVSDTYRLSIDAVTPATGEEVEPNDRRESAQTIGVGEEIRGHIGWVGDEDVFCLDPAVASAITWEVEDGDRPPGTVLQLTPTVGPSPHPLVRIHPSGARPQNRPRLEADVNSPWQSPEVSAGDDRRCLKLELTSDPWADGASAPQPSAASYVVRVR